MDRNGRDVKNKKQLDQKRAKRVVSVENKYEDAIGLDNNLNTIKPKYKFNSRNEIIL